MLKDIVDAYRQPFGYERAFRGSSAHRELRGRVLALLITSVVLDVLGTALMVTVGHHSFGTSFIWSTSSLLNGGPLLDTKTGGRHHYAGLAFDVWALTATAALAGSLGAFFHRLYLERERPWPSSPA